MWLTTLSNTRHIFPGTDYSQFAIPRVYTPAHTHVHVIINMYMHAQAHVHVHDISPVRVTGCWLVECSCQCLEGTVWWQTPWASGNRRRPELHRRIWPSMEREDHTCPVSNLRSCESTRNYTQRCAVWPNETALWNTWKVISKSLCYSQWPTRRKAIKGITITIPVTQLMKRERERETELIIDWSNHPLHVVLQLLNTM